MLQVSQKCQYALRAMFELADRDGRGPTSVADIAAAQDIPARFLELIIAELRRAGYVVSHRGVQGGYELAVSADELTPGDVIRLIDGPLNPVPCVAGPASCSAKGGCPFLGMWQRARDAVADVYDGVTFADLLEEHRMARRKNVVNYVI